jgi:hypothetical protein
VYLNFKSLGRQSNILGKDKTSAWWVALATNNLWGVNHLPTIQKFQSVCGAGFFHQGLVIFGIAESGV